MKAKAPWKPEGLCKECPHDSSDRLTIASLPLIVGFTLLLLVSFVVTLLTHEYAYLWSAARLTPLVGLGYGYELYYGLNDGPLLSTMYGPMAYLPFVPAMLASSPTNILIVGHLVGLILGLGPVVIVLFKEVQFQRLPMYRVLIGAALMILMAMFWFTFPQRQFLGNMAFGVHADSPALAFGALACFFVYGHARAPRNLSLLLSAVFATLAVWAKQIEVGLLPLLADSCLSKTQFCQRAKVHHPPENGHSQIELSILDWMLRIATNPLPAGTIGFDQNRRYTIGNVT